MDKAPTIDQRFKTVKSTVDKWTYDHYVHPKTVTKSAKEYLNEEIQSMQIITNHCDEARNAIAEMSSLLTKTQKFSEDIQTEIKKCYHMFGMDMPSMNELMGELANDSDEEPEEAESHDENTDELGIEMKKLEFSNIEDENSPMIQSQASNILFYSPTPARPKSESKIHKRF